MHCAWLDPFLTHLYKMLKQHIFRAYDIRGVYATDFDEAGFACLGEAVGKYIGMGKYLVTGDGRTHTEPLVTHLIAGLLATGADVTFGGWCPTPVTLLNLHEGDFRASLQVTASHNGAEYNGLKISTKTGSVCDAELQEIYQIAQSCSDKHAPVDMQNVTQRDATAEYANAITQLCNGLSPISVVVDAGNGIAGAAYPNVLRALGLSVHELYCDIDGTFPNHQPDPEEAENMVDCLATVKAQKALFGFVYDGDGDRVGVVTAGGDMLTADHILYVLTADFLSRNAGASVVLDIMCSAALAEEIRKLGGEVIWSPTGHSHIERTMHARNALLGGEQSGHFMFAEDFYGHDDALLATYRFLRAVMQTPELLKKVTQDWPDLSEFKAKKEVPEAQKFSIVEAVQMKLAEQFPTAVVIDGVRIDWPDGSWGILRASNTTPKISIRVQAADEATLAERAKVFTDTLDEAVAAQ